MQFSATSLFLPLVALAFMATPQAHADDDSPLSPTSGQALADQDSDELDRVMVMECDGLTFVVEIKEDQAWLFLPDYSGPLPRVSSASGEKYEANNITFWSKGDESMLDYGKHSYRGCRNNREQAVWQEAKLRGIDFRAVGNEPGWVLEIQGENLSLQTDYGKQQYLFELAAMVEDQASATTVYSASSDKHSIEVTLRGESCQDTMADKSYQTTVTIALDDRTLSGCGMALH